MAKCESYAMLEIFFPEKKKKLSEKQYKNETVIRSLPHHVNVADQHINLIKFSRGNWPF